MPTEIIADVTNLIKENWKASRATNTRTIGRNNGKLPHRTSVLPLLLAMDMHLPTSEGYSGWSDWQLIMQCGPADIIRHPWANIGLPEPGEKYGAVDDLGEGNDIEGPTEMDVPDACAIQQQATYDLHNPPTSWTTSS
ncbi:hypothetical protein V8B97DRAFT_1915829 [Scleroderma yunnanense]